MRTAIRARFAIVLLVTAPSLTLLADLCSAFSQPQPASSLRIAALAAWLPTIAVLEHFLKRRAELGSLLVSSLATMGVVGGLVSSSFRLAGAETIMSHTATAWVDDLASAVAILLPLGLALNGVAWIQWRVASRPLSLALIVGGVLGISARWPRIPGQAAIGDVAILAGCIAIAICLLRVPNAWVDAVLMRQ